MNFIASEYSEESPTPLLSEENLTKAALIDLCQDIDHLKSVIYTTYKEFGFDAAKGVFEVTVLQAYNSRN
jgi:hypothetical protein